MQGSPLAFLQLLLQPWSEDAAQPLRRQDGGVLQTPLHVPVHCTLLWGKENSSTSTLKIVCSCTKQSSVWLCFCFTFLFVSLPPFFFFALAQMGRCDSCRKQGYLTEKLQCLGSVRNFCNLPCLLQYCYMHFETNQHTSSNGTGTAPQAPHGKLCCVIISYV